MSLKQQMLPEAQGRKRKDGLHSVLNLGSKPPAP